MQSAVEQRFQRDGVTWLSYLLCATSTFTLAAMGPLMPFMREELNMNLTTAALHFSAWSAGGLIAGMTADRIVKRLGRFNAVWLGAMLICAALVVFISWPRPYLTITATFVAGICSSVVGMAVTSLMSDRFGNERAIGITELNVICSLACCAAPGIVSLCARYGFGWRGALVLPVVAYSLLYLSFRGSSGVLASPHNNTFVKPKPLPRAYWCYWSIIFFSVACEWSMVLWSAEFLEHVGKLARVDAAASVTAFLAAMVTGRMIGSRLCANINARQLLPMAGMLAIAGFLTFWLGQTAWVHILGLFLTGLGISNFYPLTLSSALELAPDQSATATARMSTGTGSAVLIAPLILGFVADHYGMFTGYGMVAILLVLCLGAVLVANKLATVRA